MPTYIRVPLALDLLLVAMPYLWPPLQGVLPLGGSHIVQIAILLLVGIGGHELNLW